MFVVSNITQYTYTVVRFYNRNSSSFLQLLSAFRNAGSLSGISYFAHSCLGSLHSGVSVASCSSTFVAKTSFAFDFPPNSLENICHIVNCMLITTQKKTELTNQQRSRIRHHFPLPINRYCSIYT